MIIKINNSKKNYKHKIKKVNNLYSMDIRLDKILS